MSFLVFFIVLWPLIFVTILLPLKILAKLISGSLRVFASALNQGVCVVCDRPGALVRMSIAKGSVLVCASCRPTTEFLFHIHPSGKLAILEARMVVQGKRD